MDLNWFFQRSKNPSNDEYFTNDKYFSEESYSKNKEENPNPPPVDPFQDFDNASHDIFKHMNSVLNSLFASTFPSFYSKDFFEPSSFCTPRSSMLKEKDIIDSCEPSVQMPFENYEKCPMIDSDIDEKVANHGLWFDKANESKDVFFCNRYTRYFKLPNGAVKEMHSSTDSKGNTITTVRRTLEEQSYEIITRSNIQGLHDKKENFINLKESELEDFEKRWENAKSGNKPTCSLMLDKMPSNEQNSISINPPLGDPTYSKLFKKFFSI